ncbi:MAG TPA: molecular chaperone HtpG [Spirochaetota bacterium]|nr:molecular chaperone HtpG [Spirochaetota bacterium]HNT10415.1 molecular chaperone HtpG [Spirochaetota bacterium]HNV48305.1 molecular chaperone HtpG [Spirochaetota bacterium]HPU86977.1 molecular chaperone HtpG [Spirochaetota bacterium]
MSSHKFQTEVNQLLHLIIHSLYSHKEIFLRELISNAADALEKLKYLTLTDDAFKSFPFDPRIDISFDKNSNILTVADTGIGMNETDLVENLGTIASSGTRKFLEQITGDQKKDSGLIGQFGVGFYSSFMVADRIEVITRKAGEDKAYRWASDGKGEYQIEEASRDGAGTTITLHLNENGAEYASRWQIEDIVKKYSNHIMFPIFLHYEDTTYEGEGDKKKEKKENKVSQINQASALWKRSKSELKEEDYHGFYKTLSHDTEAPMLYTHTQAEGAMEYTTLFYVPAKAPFDLYYRDYRAGVKLYVKRVFITDDDRELMPTYLRFVRGIIDSEDLPLNVSREMLQKNRILEKIKSASVKKILEELKKLAEDTERYAAFWKEYSRPMKEGLYMDFENREALLDLMRFKSTKADGFVSLAEYKDRMQTDQKAIYYITGEREANLRNSPLLEMYRDKDVEVLIMDDEIDEVILPQVGRYKDIELKSVNRSDAAEDLKSEGDKKAEKEVEPLVKRIKQVLGDRVKDVKASTRLSSSPSCIVADEKDPTVQMQGLLKAMGNADISSVKPILEINPAHDIVVRLKDVSDEAVFADISSLLYEQAMLIEGVKLENPGQFVERLNRVVAKAL